MTRQLALPLRIRSAPIFIDTPAHREALAILKTNTWRCAFLHGSEWSGKSHLAHRWAMDNGGAWVFDATQLESHNPTEVVDGYAAIVIENAIDMVGKADEILLHWFNAVLNAEGRLLLTDRLSPRHWPQGLPDLISRLRTAVFIEIPNPDDETMALLLAHHFAMRQLRVSVKVQNYILKRIERSYVGLHEVAQKLDRLGLDRSQPINQALAREIFDDD